MSQRLHIGPTDDPVYDAVIATEADATEERMADWLCNGPWAIRVGDLELYRKVEPSIAELFPGHFPNDVWKFFMGDRTIQHPTAMELTDWLDAG